MGRGGVGSGYRESRLICPGCKAGLDAQEILGSAVDRCAECGGLWVDWFDGDLPGIVRGVREAGQTNRASEDGREEKNASGRAKRSSILPSCPRCSRPLNQEHFHQAGPIIFRCGECLGAYVPAECAAELSRFELLETEAPAKGDEAGFWRGLIERIRLALSAS